MSCLLQISDKKIIPFVTHFLTEQQHNEHNKLSSINSDVKSNLRDTMLKDKSQQLSFEDKWPMMRPTILKLLRQEPVSRAEWHDLFWLVHSVCLWDEKGPPKVYGALREVSFCLTISSLHYIFTQHY